MKTISIEELVTYIFIESCISKLEKDNVQSASKYEKINKLKKIVEEFMDEKMKVFLEGVQ